MRNFHLVGINDMDEMRNADPLSFSFHGAKKALMYKCIRLMRPIPMEVLESLESPLAKAHVRIYKKYLENEQQDWRREIYERVIPFLILLTAEEGDPNHAEVAIWWTHELWKELDSGNVELPLGPLLPFNWWTEEKPGHGWVKVEYQGKSTTNKIIPEMEAI